MPDGDAAIDRLAAEFASRHVARLPGFLDSDLQDVVRARLRDARFIARIEDGVEIEQTLDDEATMGLFVIALNDPRVFDVVSRLTACGPIGCFTGRVYRRAERRGDAHYYPWHDDVAFGRLVGLSLNLSTEAYVGGVLQIRGAGSQAVLAEIDNRGFGDAVLFRISPSLEHQVTPVAGQAPRTVLAGWFCRQPSYADLLALRKTV